MKAIQEKLILVWVIMGLSYWEVTVAAIKMLPAGWGKKKFVRAFASFWDCTVCMPIRLPSALLFCWGSQILLQYLHSIPFRWLWDLDNQHCLFSLCANCTDCILLIWFYCLKNRIRIGVWYFFRDLIILFFYLPVFEPYTIYVVLCY